MAKMTGARFMAETVRGYGLTHVFFMPYIAPRALMEMDKLGIKHIQTHGEKAAAYDLPPLRWSSLKYDFDRGGYDGKEEAYS